MIRQTVTNNASKIN